MRKLSSALACAIAALTMVSPASAKMFNFSYSGAGVFGSGLFVTSDVGSPYQILSITGTANGDMITGLSSYAAANNLLYFPTEPFVDFSGLAFSTATSGDWGIGYTGTAYGIVNSLTNPSGGCCGVTPLTFTVSQAVPEPASWAMMIGGFALAGAGLRRVRVRTAMAIA